MSCGCNSGGCVDPIPESAEVFTVTTTPQTLSDMGVTVNPDACEIYISVLETRWSLVPIGRWTKDPAGTITASQGRLIFPFAKICLNQYEAESLFRSASGTFDIIVQQFVEPVQCDFQIPYLGVIQKLLPQGFAWEAKTISESNLYKLLNAAAKIASDLHCRTLELVDEFYPSTSDELSDLWANESFSNSLSDCLRGISLNKREKILTILAKMRGEGSYRASEFEEIAEVLGLTVDVTDTPASFTMTFDFQSPDVSAQDLCNMTACSRITDGPDMNFMLAYRCLINKVAPAQSDKVFLIDGAC